MRGSLLIVGASGQLGRRVATEAAARGCRVIGTYLSRVPELHGVTPERLDVTDPAAVARLLRQARPDAVINAALDMLGPRAWSVNADGAANVAAQAARQGIRLI